jgi:hypothetical protein
MKRRRPAWIVQWHRAWRARRARVYRECRAELAKLPQRERLEVAAAALAELTYGRSVREAFTLARRKARAQKGRKR